MGSSLGGRSRGCFVGGLHLHVDGRVRSLVDQCDFILEVVASVLSPKFQRGSEDFTLFELLRNQLKVVFHFFQTVEVVVLGKDCQVTLYLGNNFLFFNSIGVALCRRTSQSNAEIPCLIRIRIDYRNDMIPQRITVYEYGLDQRALFICPLKLLGHDVFSLR